MKKKDIFGGDVKAQLTASARDKIHRFMMAGGTIKGAVVHATRMVNEMRANHGLGIMETLLLGQAYIAAALLTSTMKGQDRISLAIQCSGPVRGIDVESNVFGEVRGFIRNTQLSEEVSGRADSLSSLFGAGFLTVTKYLTEAKRPYSGQVVLEFGTIAQDLANYFVQSEQTPTAFHLSVHFDEQGRVTGAGGLMVQAMPGADEQHLAEAEGLIGSLDSLGKRLSMGDGAEDVITREFARLSPVFNKSHRVEFFCRCTERAMLGHLATLPPEDLRDIRENGPFPLEIRCHNCNTVYGFSRVDLEGIGR